MIHRLVYRVRRGYSAPSTSGLSFDTPQNPSHDVGFYTHCGNCHSTTTNETEKKRDGNPRKPNPESHQNKTKTRVELIEMYLDTYYSLPLLSVRFQVPRTRTTRNSDLTLLFTLSCTALALSWLSPQTDRGRYTHVLFIITSLSRALPCVYCMLVLGLGLVLFSFLVVPLPRILPFPEAPPTHAPSRSVRWASQPASLTGREGSLGIPWVPTIQYSTCSVRTE